MNNKLISHTRISPNHSYPRKSKITKFVIHHCAGVISVENLGNIFANPKRYASSTYGIGHDGRIARYLPDEARPWTTGNARIDNMALTYELSNSKVGGTWPVSDIVIESTIKQLVLDALKYDIYPVTYTGDERGTLLMHKWYQNTTCPGPYLESKFAYIAKETTRRLTEIKRKENSATLITEVLPKVKKKIPVTTYKEIEEFKTVELIRDANLWDFNQKDWAAFNNPKTIIGSYKKGEKFQVATKVYNKDLNASYYVTPYSDSKKLTNGFNIKDCKEI